MAGTPISFRVWAGAMLCGSQREGGGAGGAALAGSRLPSHLPGGLRLVHSCMALARSRVKWESWQQEKEGGCPTELSGSVAGA